MKRKVDRTNYMRENRARIRMKCKENPNLCHRCGKRNKEYWSVLCSKCMKFIRKGERTERVKRIKENRCIRCGKKRLLNGKTHCSDCLTKSRKWGKEHLQRKRESRRNYYWRNKLLGNKNPEQNEIKTWIKNNLGEVKNGNM